MVNFRFISGDYDLLYLLKKYFFTTKKTVFIHDKSSIPYYILIIGKPYIYNYAVFSNCSQGVAKSKNRNS